MSIPILSTESFDKDYISTCISNGLIGFSPGPNPLMPCKTVIAGFIHEHPTMQFEQFSPAPYPLGLDLIIDEHSMRDKPDSVIVLKQSLDMSNGELTTSMKMRFGSDSYLDVNVLQFASRTVPCLIAQEIRLKTDREVTLRINTKIDEENIRVNEFKTRTRDTTGGWYSLDLIDNVRALQSDRCRLGIAQIIPRGNDITQKGISRYEMKLKPGIERSFQMVSSVVADIYHFEPHLEAIRLARWGDMVGYDRLKLHNRSAWDELWKSRIKVTGCDEEDQQALDVAFYYLHSNIHPSTKTGFPPFGLTQNGAYYGHNFWDTDLWTFIPTVLVQPDAGKATIEYRHRGLDAAKNRAKLFGYRGAQYPWEASIDGSEVTPSCCPTGWAQQHTTVGVAWCAWEYYMATGDDFGLKDLVWPIIKNINEWVESRGRFTKRGFEFDMMMGPDEYINDLSNQTYFNLLAKKSIQAGIECCKIMGYSVPRNWKNIYRNIFIPMDNNHGVVLPYDPDSMVTAYDENSNRFIKKKLTIEGQTYSLGNLHFLFVHGLPVDDKIFKNTYLAEEKIRLERDPEPGVPGSERAPSFTSPVYMACAAFNDEREKSAELFKNSWKPYWLDPYGMTLEYQSQDYGSYITSFGSLLQQTMLGLTGLRIKTDDNWSEYESKLPDGWESIDINQLYIKGNPVSIHASHGKKAVIDENNN